MPSLTLLTQRLVWTCGRHDAWTERTLTRRAFPEHCKRPQTYNACRRKSWDASVFCFQLLFAAAFRQMATRGSFKVMCLLYAVVCLDCGQLFAWLWARQSILYTHTCIFAWWRNMAWLCIYTLFCFAFFDIPFLFFPPPRGQFPETVLTFWALAPSRPRTET